MTARRLPRGLEVKTIARMVSVSPNTSIACMALLKLMHAWQAGGAGTGQTIQMTEPEGKQAVDDRFRSGVCM
jgi:hypothetical protein